VLSLTKLQSLVQVRFQFLFKGVHLILLLLNELSLVSNNLLRSFLHVPFTLFGLQLLASDLNLMCLLILFLLGQVVLDFLHVQKLRAKFESQWKFISEDLSIALNLSCVPRFELAQGLGIFFLSLKQILVPLLVEFLVLLNVSLLALLSLLCLVENELLVSAVIVLLLKLNDSILGHLGLNILSFAFTRVSVILKYLNKVLDVVGIWLLIKSLLVQVVMHHLRFWLVFLSFGACN